MRHDPPDPNDAYHHSLQRLTILTDGVFAIAMTLLAIELALPESAQHLRRYDLLRALLATWPHVFAYVQSFSILALFWLVNHRLHRVLWRVDQPYLLLHLLFLLFIAFQPYPTSVLGAGLYLLWSTTIIASCQAGILLCETSQKTQLRIKCLIKCF